jgi:hypothetical protein
LHTVSWDKMLWNCILISGDVILFWNVIKSSSFPYFTFPLSCDLHDCSTGDRIGCLFCMITVMIMIRLNATVQPVSRCVEEDVYWLYYIRLFISHCFQYVRLQAHNIDGSMIVRSIYLEGLRNATKHLNHSKLCFRSSFVPDTSRILVCVFTVTPACLVTVL